MAVILSGISIPLVVLYQAICSRTLLDSLGIFLSSPKGFPYEPFLRVVELLISSLLLPILVTAVVVRPIAGRSFLTPSQASASTTVTVLASFVHMMI